MKQFVLVSIACLFACFCKAQLPSDYIGTWRVLPDVRDYYEYKSNYIDYILADTIGRRNLYFQYKTDSSRLFKELQADFDSLARTSIRFNEDSTYEYTYYDKIYVTWRTNTGTYYYDKNMQELTIENACAGHTTRSKVAVVSQQPFKITLTEIYTGVYSVTFGCFMPSVTLQKLD